MNEPFNEFDLLEILKMLIPDGTNQGCSNSNGSISVKNENGVITIEGHYPPENSKDEQCEEKYDDTYIKSIVSKYKKCIEKLDDCLFVNALEDIGKVIDVKKFDALLNQTSFTKEEAGMVNYFINQSTQIIQGHLQDKIQELVDIYEYFFE